MSAPVTAHVETSLAGAAPTRDAGPPARVPMSEPDITDAERAAVAEVLATPTLAGGPRLAAFEAGLAAYVGAHHAIGVSSGTAGLHLCMIAAGVGRGDVVLTTSFSFVASANCALYVGARPVFVDVDPDNLTLDPVALERAVRNLAREGVRPKAVLPVHVFGQAADMDPILDVARRHGLAVVEDACEAVGAEYKGRAAGTLGDAGVFAFYPNKQMTTGEGGMIVTADPEWDALFRSLRNQGRDVFDGSLTHSRLGYNYRLDELSAALGAVQVDRVDEILARRAAVAACYHARLARVAAVTPLNPAPWTTRFSWFVYVVWLEPAYDRDALIAALARRGIPARPYFPPIHQQPYFRPFLDRMQVPLPITEAAGASCLALPFFGTMSEAQVATVCDALVDALPDCSRHRRGGVLARTAGGSA